MTSSIICFSLPDLCSLMSGSRLNGIIPLGDGFSSLLVMRRPRMLCRVLMDGRADYVFSTGAEGAKQHLEGRDTEEKKSQISADSGLSVTSGSQVGFNLISRYKS